MKSQYINYRDNNMIRPSRLTSIEKVLDKWDDKEAFYAEKFAEAYNNIYSHYAISSSGFYTFFLKLEKSGRIEIIRSGTNKKNKYRKVFREGEWEALNEKSKEHKGV